MPQVSVVIPSFNHAAYIEEAVRSVLAQSFDDLELIVVDDGSTDDSVRLLRQIDDARLRVVEQANQGAHAALNAGLALARGELLAVLNSDDAYLPQRLTRIAAAFAQTPDAGLIGSWIEVIGARGEVLGVKHGARDLSPWALAHPERGFRAGDDLRGGLLTENFWSTTSNFVVRRALWEQVGPFRPLRYTHDWDFALRAAARAPSVLLPETLLRYRVHDRNTIREHQAAMVLEICWILAVHLPQHLADDRWASQAEPARRVEQLLHSIYTFGCDRVLSVMLLERLHERPDAALALLDRSDPRRLHYLALIEETLAPPPKTARRWFGKS